MMSCGLHFALLEAISALLEIWLEDCLSRESAGLSLIRSARYEDAGDIDFSRSNDTGDAMTPSAQQVIDFWLQLRWLMWQTPRLLILRCRYKFGMRKTLCFYSGKMWALIWKSTELNKPPLEI